jgi:hypothetical protein
MAQVKIIMDFFKSKWVKISEKTILHFLKEQIYFLLLIGACILGIFIYNVPGIFNVGILLLIALFIFFAMWSVSIALKILMPKNDFAVMIADGNVVASVIYLIGTILSLALGNIYSYYMK